ncbi:MAG: hypothetical protein MUO63_11500, partial [Desulfobulbaceae bacterium]|nr:hypothetical protein [Desulfobulbaceae bacterium]
MKRLVNFFAILSILMSSCSIPPLTTPTPPPIMTETPIVAETPSPTWTAIVTEVPTASVPAPPAPNVNCFGLSLYLDPAL